MHHHPAGCAGKRRRGSSTQLMTVPGRFCCKNLSCERRGRVSVEGFFYCRLLGGKRRLTPPTRPLPYAHATHAVASGGGRATSPASLRRFWAIAASVNRSVRGGGHAVSVGQA